MPRKHDRKEPTIAGCPADPVGMHALVRDYLQSLRIRNYAEGTIRKRRLQLNDFIRWSADRAINKPVEITRSILEAYQRHLFYGLDRHGRRYTFGNQHSRLTSIRSWFKWLARQRYIEANPASELELPKLAKRLPKYVLSQSEAEEVINITDASKPLGMRDRAILETLYSTGIRRMELINLHVYDVDPERGVLAVRQGKGRKDRVVPIGTRALAWVEKYRHDIRPSLLVDENETTLFITNQGQPFSPTGLSVLVREYVNQAKTGKQGSCHLFRHTMATLMHENGADIRFIQAMLGHAKLDTTQIYTQVSIRKLKEIHEATHPAKQKRDN